MLGLPRNVSIVSLKNVALIRDTSLLSWILILKINDVFGLNVFNVRYVTLSYSLWAAVFLKHLNSFSLFIDSQMYFLPKTH